MTILYKTKNKILIENYLSTLSGKLVTVNDISTYFFSKNINIGTATIYRILDQLIKQEKVRKFASESGKFSYFEYIDSEQRGYHLKCEDCSKLLNINCSVFKSLMEHMLEQHGTYLNISKTIFFGKCLDCTKKKDDL